MTKQMAQPADRVLLIEDEPNIAEALGFILGRDGWQVFHHADGAGALERARELRPQVVVLDHMLPNHSGLEILRALRAEDWAAQIPIVMLTARGLGRDRDAALAAGATRFLTKPFANADVIATLRALRVPEALSDTPL